MANLYKLVRPDFEGFDAFDSCVVVANSEDEARKIHPKASYPGDEWWFSNTWCSEEDTHLLEVWELGVAFDNLIPGTVVLASFNALCNH